MKIVFSRKGFDSANDPSLFVGNGDRFTLTAPGSRSRSRWRLPSWFYPSGGCPILDHHYNRKLWRRSKPRVYLDTVGHRAGIRARGRQGHGSKRLAARTVQVNGCRIRTIFTCVAAKDVSGRSERFEGLLSRIGRQNRDAPVRIFHQNKD